MKLIFLDIDGVLVNRESFRLPRTKCAGLKTSTANTAHPNCVEVLNHVIAETDARVVISSVWRMHGLTTMRELFTSWGVSATIVGLTPDLRKSNPEWADVERGEEIQQWLNTVRIPVERFVIIDDDADMNGLKPFLVQTKFEPGLTMKDAERAIAILNHA